MCRRVMTCGRARREAQARWVRSGPAKTLDPGAAASPGRINHEALASRSPGAGTQAAACSARPEDFATGAVKHISRLLFGPDTATGLECLILLGSESWEAFGGCRVTAKAIFDAMSGGI